MENTLVLVLSSPVKIGEQEWTEMRLREPTVGENEKALTLGATVASNIYLVSVIAGIPEAVVRKMSRGDFLKAIDFFDSVTASIRGIGES
jgi:Phage tail assembly chaperone proteins, E, or 41 or 14